MDDVELINIDEDDEEDGDSDDVRQEDAVDT